MPGLSSTCAGCNAITPGDRIVGVFLLISGIVIVVAARTTATVLPAFSLLVIGAAYFESTSLRGIAAINTPTAFLAAFLGLATLSSVWAPDPAETLSHTLICLASLGMWQLLRTWINAQPVRRVHHLAYWFVIAIAIGLAILTIEVWAHQPLRRLIMAHFDVLVPPTLDKHYRIDAAGNIFIYGFEFNRSVAAANMVLWPALLCAASLWSGRAMAVIGIALATAVAAVTFGSGHETSKVSFAAGLAVFLLASFKPRLAAGTLGGLWLGLILGVVPAALVAYNYLHLHNSPWLQHSAQERIVIWNDVGERVKLSPWLGAGARTAHVLSAEGIERLKKGHAAEKRRTHVIARHAHNVYLQTWFELGIAGALLLLAGGLSVLLAATRVVPSAQPHLLATFAVFMAEIGSSWEIWQRWFLALFVLTAVFALLGLRSTEAASPTAKTS